MSRTWLAVRPRWCSVSREKQGWNWGHPPAPGAVLHVETKEVVEHRLPERQPGTREMDTVPGGGGSCLGDSARARQPADARGTREVTPKEAPQLVQNQPAWGQDSSMIPGSSRLTPCSRIPTHTPTCGLQHPFSEAAPYDADAGSHVRGGPLPSLSSCHLFIAKLM